MPGLLNSRGAVAQVHKIFILAPKILNVRDIFQHYFFKEFSKRIFQQAWNMQWKNVYMVMLKVSCLNLHVR
jgi:hypothetical protein